MDRRMAQDLDNWITGHWGKDIFPAHEEGVCYLCGSKMDVTYDEDNDFWICAICIEETEE